MQHSLRSLVVGLIVLLCLLNESEGWRRRRRRRRSCSCAWHWGSCSQTCGRGVRSPVITTNCNCNVPSPEACNPNPCPINCAWSGWAYWSKCSVSCGGGTQSRSRSVSTPAQFGGEECEGLSSENKKCNTDCCPGGVDCVLKDWMAWGACSLTCGYGTRSRKRLVETPATCGGSPCGERLSSEGCNDGCCPIDCVWSEWSEWGSCNGECWSATKSRTRTKSTDADCECVGEETETQECDEQC